MANSPTSLFPLGSGQGVDERQLGQNSALRNGFLYGKTNAGTFNAVVTDAAGGALAIATDWTHDGEPPANAVRDDAVHHAGVSRTRRDRKDSVPVLGREPVR